MDSTSGPDQARLLLGVCTTLFRPHHAPCGERGTHNPGVSMRIKTYFSICWSLGLNPTFAKTCDGFTSG